MNKQVLKAQNLTKEYKNTKALTNFNLNLYEGEILGLAGPNGAGKTTLLKILAGLTPDYQGSLSILDSNTPKELTRNREYTSCLIEAPAFFNKMTAYKNLDYYRIQRGVTDPKRVDEVLDLVGLDHAKDKKFKDFSLGMKQRLGMGLALLHKPRILFFDEPTNGLDPKAIVHIRDILKNLALTEGTAIIVSSHILTEMEHLANRFVIINDGEKLSEFTSREISNKVRGYYEIESLKPDLVATTLEEKLNTSNYEVNQDGLVLAYDTDIDPSLMLENLVNTGCQVTSFTLKKGELEDIYLDTIGEGDLHD